MAEHGVDPHEYLADVHDIEMDMLEENAPLAAAIAKLPGRKLIFTNADAPYATQDPRTARAGRQLRGDPRRPRAELSAKPEPFAYRHICDAYDLDPTNACSPTTWRAT